MRLLLILAFALCATIFTQYTQAYEHNYEIIDLTREKHLDSQTCLAYTLYHESRGETDLSNIMVLSVIWNRMKSNRFPNTLCGVVKQRHQFSYLFDGESDEITDKDSYDKLYNLVEEFIMNKKLLLSISGEATHYHTINVKPVWSTSSKMKYISTYGKHKFYKEIR